MERILLQKLFSIFLAYFGALNMQYHGREQTLERSYWFSKSSLYKGNKNLSTSFTRIIFMGPNRVHIEELPLRGP